jgi:dienelactone hydrolase
MGPSDHEKNAAEKLAQMGYVAFVADVYGKGVRPDTPKAAGEEMCKYLKDRPLLLARAQAALDQLSQSQMVDVKSSRQLAIALVARQRSTSDAAVRLSSIL